MRSHILSIPRYGALPPEHKRSETTMAQAEHEYDLFISYAAADRPWVEGYLLDALTEAAKT